MWGNRVEKWSEKQESAAKSEFGTRVLHGIMQRFIGIRNSATT
jgi:hypothetical protein